ncbi:MAG: hypothetical protein UV38_C0002G0061 [candidate division TM6 bacterium GW2011_GWE2_42_60]|nr:MAG: hypothetical protein UV38_C0002G0061 [candidate division TM6 bacterium GW2011_GWE2_42_60]HBY06183.1 hypothetical protein [Candidatus Dependentiae bacterium]
MNKRYIVFALALFACFGGLKDINATEMVELVKAGEFKLNESATTEDLIKLIQEKGAQIVELDFSKCKNIDFTNLNLSGCNKLQTLDLSYTNITTEDLNKIISSRPELICLYLDRCNKLDFANLNLNGCVNLLNLDLSYTNITTEDLNKIISSRPELICLYLLECNAIDFTDINWSKNELEALYLNSTYITPDGLKKILASCPNLRTLDLWECKFLDEKYRNCYQTKEAIEELKKDLGIENQKSLPINPKPSWLVAKWQALSTPWKWALGIGAVAIPLIGACIFYKYKRSQCVKNLSGAIWRRLAPLLRRQKLTNQPLVVQNRYQI